MDLARWDPRPEACSTACVKRSDWPQLEAQRLRKNLKCLMLKSSNFLHIDFIKVYTALTFNFSFVKSKFRSI